MNDLIRSVIAQVSFAPTNNIDKYGIGSKYGIGKKYDIIEIISYRYSYMPSGIVTGIEGIKLINIPTVLKNK